MKKAIITLVMMLTIVFVSIGSVAAAFVYPSGLVKYNPSWLGKDKTTTTLKFKGQPDTAGAYDYRIVACVKKGTRTNPDLTIKTASKEGKGILYYTSSRSYSVSAWEYDGSHGLGIMQVFTTTHGELSDYWYDY